MDEYRTTPGVDYQSIPELVESLLKEQGYICAYCMRRIPCRDKISNEDHHIEHILSRDNHPDKKLDYHNMVICCPGHIGDKDHCDRLKGEKDVSFNLFDDQFIATLSYKTDGEIVSSNKQYNDEINDVLNLNTPLLKANRKDCWNGVVQNLVTLKKDKAWDKATLRQHLQKYSSLHDKNGKLQHIPYCGIVIYNLQKKLKQLQ
jgi:uncharacterized protein (TIGR02646 family)